MDLHLRSELKALPVWNSADFPLKARIADFLLTCESAETDIKAIRTALNKLSDTELDRYSHPQIIASTSQATSFLAEKCSQSSQYHWKRKHGCLLLISRNRFSKRRHVPGVAFEFVVRTGISEWTIYRIPDPSQMFGCAVYMERNELIVHSRRPVKAPIRAVPKKSGHRLACLWRAIVTALKPLPTHNTSFGRR